MRDLTVSLFQCDLAWEKPGKNRTALLERLRDAAPQTDVLALPEMFTTGFSMNAQDNAEPADGPTAQWMQSVAQEFDCAVAGSVPIAAHGGVVNRLLFVTPEEQIHYDKRHLFRMAGEHQVYVPGKERKIVSWRDWRIKLEVCYDLRFPVFARNRQDYDLLLNVANWPARRAAHWRALLRARAIENLACVVGVNRVGSDGVGVAYAGDSLAFDAQGETLLDMQDRNALESVQLSSSALLEYRKRFPSFMDADGFVLDMDTTAPDTPAPQP